MEFLGLLTFRRNSWETVDGVVVWQDETSIKRAYCSVVLIAQHVFSALQKHTFYTSSKSTTCSTFNKHPMGYIYSILLHSATKSIAHCFSFLKPTGKRIALIVIELTELHFIRLQDTEAITVPILIFNRETRNINRDNRGNHRSYPKP